MFLRGFYTGLLKLPDNCAIRLSVPAIVYKSDWDYKNFMFCANIGDYTVNIELSTLIRCNGS